MVKLVAKRPSTMKQEHCKSIDLPTHPDITKSLSVVLPPQQRVECGTVGVSLWQKVSHHPLPTPRPTPSKALSTEISPSLVPGLSTPTDEALPHTTLKVTSRNRVIRNMTRPPLPFSQNGLSKGYEIVLAAYSKDTVAQTKYIARH